MNKPVARKGLLSSAKVRDPLTLYSITFYATVLLLMAQMLSGTVFAASLGMFADNEADMFRLFDADTGVVVASLQGSKGRTSADCALSNDESTGFSSNASRHISVFQLQDSRAGKDAVFTSIEISNIGVDMSLSPDGRLLVSTGAGNIHEPLSIIDTASKTEVAASAPFLDHTSAEFCDDGTLLITTTYGHSFAQPFDNAMYDARLGSNGELQLSGHRLSSGATPNNGSCAPGSRSGVLLDREAGITSFTLPGMAMADSAKLNSPIAVSAVFSHSGDRLYVRTTTTVEAFDFNPFNGDMTADWVQQVAYTSEYFGVDQIAVHPDNGLIYVDGGRELLILDPHNGQQTGLVQAGDATGICFAQRQRHTPVSEIAASAP
jgi:hypothetical protein